MTSPASPAPGVVVAVVGATATGKSDLALDLAQRWGGEIVGADASQLYRGMDIGTAKVPVDQRRGVPHHQIDVLEIWQEASVAAYQRAARADIAAIIARGRTPVLVGGSGLYVRAALDHLQIPPTDPQVRARLQERADAEGAAVTRERLAALDPAAARAIEPNNVRRLVRALEAIELTGRPFSASLPERALLRPTVLLGVRRSRVDLDERIGRRTAAMWEAGLPQEVAALAAQGLEQTRTAGRAIGYRQGLDELAGRTTRAEAIEATAAATRRLVRRQESWFRADPRIRWVDAAPEATPAAVLQAALAAVAAGPDPAAQRDAGAPDWAP